MSSNPRLAPIIMSILSILEQNKLIGARSIAESSHTLKNLRLVLSLHIY